MHMKNLSNLREQIEKFAFYSKPSNANSSAPCTVGDINKVIKNLTELLNSFADELEEDI